MAKKKKLPSTVHQMRAAASSMGLDAQGVVVKMTPPELPHGVIPAGAKMAQDACSNLTGYVDGGSYSVSFMGYQQLADLAQISEYRSAAETTASECTREWIDIKCGDGDKQEQIKAINEALKQHKVQGVLERAIEIDQLYGRAQIAIRLSNDSDTEAQTMLTLDGAKVAPGMLRGFTVIEPVWTYPAEYNSTDPMAVDFFKPTAWYVMGRRVHASRLITLVSRPVPDILKPVYNFGGISLSQLMKPYVDRWLRTAQSVSDLINCFSVMGVKTNLSAILSGGEADGLVSRAKLFNATRDNRGLMMLDKENEEFFNASAPLSGLDKLLAQAQEQMAAPSHTPLVKLLGVTPSGLNASNDGEIRVYYDFIRAMQERILREPITKIIKLIQLDLFGAIDESIAFDFVSLEQESQNERSLRLKTEADRDATLITAGVIDAAEARERLESDPDSGYNNLVLVDEETQDPSADNPIGSGGGEGGEEAATTGAANAGQLHLPANSSSAERPTDSDRRAAG